MAASARIAPRLDGRVNRWKVAGPEAWHEPGARRARVRTEAGRAAEPEARIRAEDAGMCEELLRHVNDWLTDPATEKSLAWLSMRANVITKRIIDRAKPVSK